MSAMRGYPIHRDASAAELRPTDAAMLANAASGVMMIHHALPDRRFALGHTGPARRDDAAGLVATDERVFQISKTQSGLRFPGRRAVELEIRAAHARGLHLDDHLARTGRGIGEVAHFDLPVPEKDSAAHRMIL